MREDSTEDFTDWAEFSSKFLNSSLRISKEISCEMEYIIDSFPVEVCKNIRINRSKIVKGKQWRGYTASM